MQQQQAAAAAAAEIKCCSRTPCCSKVGLNRGPWSPDEDLLLTKYIQTFGEGRWRTLPKKAGLKRCGKSCRLRWMNYLRPDVKRGYISPEEEDLILRLHRLLGNRWSLIAGRIPGRTDNEIKNYWNTHLKKKLLSQGIDPGTHKPLAAESLLEKPLSSGSGKGRPKASSSSSEREKQQHQQSKSDAVLDQQIHPSVTCSSSPHEDLSQQQQFRGCDFGSVNETKQTHQYHHRINHDGEDSSSCFQDKPRTAFDDFPVLQPPPAADTNPTPNVNSFPDLNCHQSPQQQPETSTVHAQLKPQLLLLKPTAAATSGSSASAYEHHHTNNNHHLAIPFLLQDLFTSAAASPSVPLDNSSTSSDRLLSRLHHQPPPFQHLHFPHSFMNGIHSNETDDALKHSYTTNPHAAASLLSMEQSHSNPAFLEMLPPLSATHHHQNHHHHDSMMSLQQQQQPLSSKNMEMDTSGFDQSILQRLNKAHEASFFTADVSNLLMMNNNDRRNSSSSSSIDFSLGYVHHHQGLFDININASGNAVVASSIGSSVVSNNPSHLHESVNNLSCDSWMLSHCHPQV